MAELEQNLSSVRQRIQRAVERTKRDPAGITLLAVTKGRSLDDIRRVFDCGLRLYGENRVQEGSEKIQNLRDLRGVQWHMIGHIQSRKAARAVAVFDLIHSVDGLALSVKLDGAAGTTGRKIPVLLECNVSGEPAKSGWLMEGQRSWEARLDEIRQAAELPHLAVHGLMTMAPLGADEQTALGVFGRLRSLQTFLRERIPGGDWGELSMGMSDDFEAAIMAGATILRLGRAIFGDNLRQTRVQAV